MFMNGFLFYNALYGIIILILLSYQNKKARVEFDQLTQLEIEKIH